MEDKETQPLISKQSLVKFFTSKRQLQKLIKILLPYVLIYVILLATISFFEISPEAVTEFFMGKGVLLVPLFIGLQLLASLTPLPDLPFIAAGILFFAPWQAFLLIWLGMWLGSLINFWIARRLGQDYVHTRYPQTSAWVDKFAGRYGVETVIIGRNFTFVTFDLIAYAAGVSKMRYRVFALASILGVAPVALNATLLGWALLKSTQNPLIGILLFGVSATLALGLGWCARAYRSWSDRQARARAKLDEVLR